MSKKERQEFYKNVKVLEADISFLTPNINEKEYYNYISIIKEKHLTISKININQCFERKQKEEIKNKIKLSKRILKCK